MFRGGPIRAFGANAAPVLVCGALALSAGALVPAATGTAAGAAAAAKAQSPADWTDTLCTGLVAWQAAALDARDAAFAIVGMATADKPSAKAAALRLDAALKPPTKAIDAVADNLERRRPKGKNGAAVGNALATDI